MPVILVTKPFKFAHDGVRVEHIQEGNQVVTEACAKVALAEGWAVPATKEPSHVRPRAHASAKR